MISIQFGWYKVGGERDRQWLWASARKGKRRGHRVIEVLQAEKVKREAGEKLNKGDEQRPTKPCMYCSLSLSLSLYCLSYWRYYKIVLFHITSVFQSFLWYWTLCKAWAAPCAICLLYSAIISLKSEPGAKWAPHKHSFIEGLTRDGQRTNLQRGKSWTASMMHFWETTVSSLPYFSREFSFNVNLSLEMLVRETMRYNKFSFSSPLRLPKLLSVRPRKWSAP